MSWSEYRVIIKWHVVMVYRIVRRNVMVFIVTIFNLGIKTPAIVHRGALPKKKGRRAEVCLTIFASCVSTVGSTR